MSSDQHTQLRDNVRLLGSMLGETLKDQVDEDLLNMVEKIRKQAKLARSEQDWQSLVDTMSSLSDTDLIRVARAFTHFLNYANIADQHHLVRESRQRQRDPTTAPGEGTMAELISRLLNHGHSPDEILSALTQQKTELVLTAHPTEITRRSLRRKYNDISEILSNLDRRDLTQGERDMQLQRLRRRIIAGWHTDEIRHHRPTPVDEAKWGFATVESTLWKALPEFLRELDTELFRQTGLNLPLDATPIGFASWMGGDRDGNPNVTAEVTREVLSLARWQAADLLEHDINELREDLSMADCNDTLRLRVGDHREPYRELLRGVRQRLENTRQWATATLQGHPFEGDIYRDNDELLEPLLLIRQSLIDCDMEAIAQGSLETIIRRIACFGLTLTKLDIRQESSRHSDVIQEITEYLGIRYNDLAYADWPETEKQSFLLRELHNKRPLIPDDFPATPDTQEVLDTFAVLADQPPSALGAYIISMAHRPSDVLAVRLLQKATGCKYPQRIAPLFETLNDLENAADTLRQLLMIDWYRQDIQGHQEVMIGYSDSAKDAGFLAASWAQYRTQEALSKVCDQYGIHLTLFHGRGGSTSRGGGPAREALLSQPPGTIRGSVRVTEQGEMIQFKFGLPELAKQNLELYTAATLEATLSPAPAPRPTWRNMMQLLADESVKAYRQVVHDDPRFVAYFRQVTPEQELSRLALGSRPAKRKASGGVESLRAIPWVFAWTQMRLMLSAWLGVSEALASQIKHGDKALLQGMHENWHFFRMLMDMLEMVLAKADLTVATYYEDRLLEDVSLKDLGRELQRRLRQAQTSITSISQKPLLADNPTLEFSINVRNPYLDPLHITQVELMRRLRQSPDNSDPLLEQGLMISIAGIAAGMRNTG